VYVLIVVLLRIVPTQLGWHFLRLCSVEVEMVIISTMHFKKM